MGACEAPMRQIPLAIGPEAQPSFASFATGSPGNAAAVAHLRGWRLPEFPSAPVYLWGPPGTGKSHLLRALEASCRAQGGQAAWFAPAVALPWTVPPGCSLALIDECQALDAAEQHAAFTVLVESATQPLAVVAAGALPPVDLPLREDLRTRLGWGHVFALQPLSEADTRAVVRQEADRRGIFLPDEVMDYLLTHLDRDLKHLMNLLDRLDHFSLVHKRGVTLPLLRAMFADEAALREATR